MIRTRPIKPHPQLITFAGSGRTNVRVRVMAVNSPGGQNAFGEAVFARSPDVIHDLLTTIFDDGFAYSCRQIVEYFIPANPLPFAFTAFAGALQRIKYSIGIGDLIERRRSLGTISSARTRILGVAFELLD